MADATTHGWQTKAKEARAGMTSKKQITQIGTRFVTWLGGTLLLTLVNGVSAAESARNTLPSIEIRAQAPTSAAPALPERRIEIDAAGENSALRLAELLDQLPGVYARSRGNLAQDLQLSSRGHGTRSSFGVRGLRLYVDGIPASAPDGQGQLSQLSPWFRGELSFASGPLAAFYGNASGGLLRFVSAPIEQPTGALWMAAGAQQKGAALEQDWRGPGGGWRGLIGQLELRGPRPHSTARRQYVSLAWQAPTGSSGNRPALPLNFRFDHFSSPLGLDPLGLTAEQYAADPFAASPNALLYNTRKRSAQDQLGAHGSHPLGAGDWQWSAWGGQREVEQYLAVPPVAQRNPRSGGGVIDLRRRFSGIESGFRRDWGVLSLSLGLRLEQQDERRRGYENFVADRLGVRGALRRDERNSVHSTDPFVLLDWTPAPGWQALAGWRRSALRYRSLDRYIAEGNPDDSGQRHFVGHIPLLALGFQGEHAGWRIAAARGFEAPTGNELAYRADGQSGFNIDLRPSRSQLLELGFSARSSARAAWLSGDLTLFDEQVKDELIVLQSSAGRSVYGNVDRSRRRGIELAGEIELAAQLRLRGSATWLDARFVGGELDGRRLPAVAQRFAQLGLNWSASAKLELKLLLEASSGVFVDDRNRLRSAGHARWDLLITRRFGANWQLDMQLNNLLDRRYVGSVIVNESNGRYLETVAGRELAMQLRWRW